MALAQRSVVDALADELKSDIIKGVLLPGTALPEMTIAQRYDVARPTAKAAIEQLVYLGLLRRSPNKTARVPVLDAADVADLYKSRTVIERAIVCLVAESGASVFRANSALSDLRSAIGGDGDVTQLVASDIAFHRALADAADSPRLKRLHEAVIGESHLCMAQVQVHHLLDPEVIADEHGRILDAIKAGDPTLAESEMVQHLTRAQRSLIAHLTAPQSPSVIVAGEAVAATSD